MSRRWAERVNAASEAVASLIFACVFGVFLLKIVMRYVAGDALAWADELSTVLFIWLIFWANAFLLPDRKQIAFDLLYRNVGLRWRRIMMVVRLAVVGGLFAWALPGVVDYLHFLWRERTPVLQWRLDLVYACFGLFVFAVALRSLLTLISVLTNSSPRGRGSAL